jgi:VanZ family protein
MLIANRLAALTAGVFFLFIIWIIIVSDAGGSNFVIDSVRAIPYGDKLGHMVLYGVLAILVNISFARRKRNHLGLPLGCALVLLFALVEELSQGFFPSTRTLDVGDMAADLIGIYGVTWVMREKGI